jgi:CheY-like chemotaxis protein
MQQGSGGPLVLVVDDDEDTRELYRLIFESAGYRVAEAGFLRQAAAVLLTDPAIVLTDWLLPDGNGLDVCAAASARGAGIRVIAVTGLALDEEQQAAARARGCVAILQKPIDPDALLAAVVAGLSGPEAVPRR